MCIIVSTETVFFFSSKVTPFLSEIIKVRLICLQNKSSLIKLGLIIHISAVRVVIDHILFYVWFAETCHKESRTELLKARMDFSGDPTVKTVFLQQGVWVQSPAGELRSHMPWSADKKNLGSNAKHLLCLQYLYILMISSFLKVFQIPWGSWAWPFLLTW